MAFRALNEVTPPLAVTLPDLLQLLYELEDKEYIWYAITDIANAFFFF